MPTNTPNARTLIEQQGRAPLLGWIDQRPPGSISLTETNVAETLRLVRRLLDAPTVSRVRLVRNGD